MNSSTPNRLTDRDRASYFSRKTFCRWKNRNNGICWMATRMIVPGVEVICAPGHNADMMCVRLTGGGKTVFFLPRIWIPTLAHYVPLPWIMGYDLYPLTTLESKKKVGFRRW